MMMEGLWYVVFLLVGLTGGIAICALLAGKVGRTFMMANLAKKSVAVVTRKDKWADFLTFRGKYWKSGREMWKVNPDRMFVTRDKLPIGFWPDWSALNLSPRDALVREGENVDWRELKKSMEEYVPSPSELAYLTSSIQKAREELPTLEEKKPVPLKAFLFIILIAAVAMVALYILHARGVI